MKPMMTPSLCPIVLALAAVFSGKAMADSTWDGSSDRNWNNGQNWSGYNSTSGNWITNAGVPDNEGVILDGRGHAPIVTASPSRSITTLAITGNSNYSNATLEVQGGTLTVTNDATVIGRNGRSATFAVNGNAHIARDLSVTSLGNDAKVNVTNNGTLKAGSVSVDGLLSSLTVNGKLEAGSVNLKNNATFTSTGVTDVKGEFKLENNKWQASGTNSVGKLTNTGSEVNVTSGSLTASGSGGSGGVILKASSANNATLTIGDGGSLTVAHDGIALTGADNHAAELKIDGIGATVGITVGNLTATAGGNANENVGITVTQGSLTVGNGSVGINGAAGGSTASLNVGGSLGVTSGDVSLTNATGDISGTLTIGGTNGLDLEAINKATSLNVRGTLEAKKLTLSGVSGATFTSSGKTNIDGLFTVGDYSQSNVTGGTTEVGRLTNIGGEIKVTDGKLKTDGQGGIILKGSSNNGASLTVGNHGSLTVDDDGITLTGDGGHTVELKIDGTGATTGITKGNLTATANGSGENVSIDVTQGTLTVNNGSVGVTGSRNADATLAVGGTGSKRGTLRVEKGNLSLTDATGTVKADSALYVLSNDDTLGTFRLTAIHKATFLDVGGSLTVTHDVTLEGDNSAKKATLTAEEDSRVTIGGKVTLKNFGRLSIKSDDKDIFSVAGNIVGGGDLSVKSNWGILSFDQSGRQTQSNDIVGKLNLETTVFGSTTLLQGKTAYSGTTHIAQGATLKLENDGDLSSSAATVRGTLDLRNDASGKAYDTARITLATDTTSTLTPAPGKHTGTVLTGAARNLVVDLDASNGKGFASFAGLLADSDSGTGTNLIVTNTSDNDAKLTLSTVRQNYEGKTIVQAASSGHVTLALGKDGNDKPASIENSRKLQLKGINANAKAIFAIDAIDYVIDSDWISGDEYSALEVNDSARLTVGGEKTRHFHGDIGGEGKGYLIKNDTGTWILSGGTQRNGLDVFDISAGRVTLQGTNVSGQATAGAGTLTVLNHAHVTDGAVLELHGNATIKGAAALDAFSDSYDHSLEIRSAGSIPATAAGASMNSLNAKDSLIRVFIDNDSAFYTVGGQTILTLTSTAPERSDFENAHVEIFSVKPLGHTLNLIGGPGTDRAKLGQAHYYVQNGFLTQYVLTPLAGGVPGQFHAAPQGTGQAKAFSEGFLGGAGLLNLGGDLLTDKGLSSAARNAAHGDGAGKAFAALAGGRIKHKTGSHVDVSGKGLVVGLAAGVGASPSRATVGAFLEYGHGNYDSYNDSSRVNEVRGSGNADYFGGGVLGRLEFSGSPDGQSYLEATARAGQVKNEFKANDLEAYVSPAVRGKLHAGYEAKSRYYGLSLGGGHVWNLGSGKTLDVYGRYLWTHQSGDIVRLETLPMSEKEEIRFSPVNSHRLRVGARYSVAWGNSNHVYAGAALEQEFDGKANARIRATGARIDAPSLKGNTGIVELGLVFTPTESKNLSVDLGFQVHGGKREGVTGGARLKYVF